MSIAQRVNPLYPEVHSIFVCVLLSSHRHDKTIAECPMLEREPAKSECLG